MKNTKFYKIVSNYDNKTVGICYTLEELDRCFESYVNRYGNCKIIKEVAK